MNILYLEAMFKSRDFRNDFFIQFDKETPKQVEKQKDCSSYDGHTVKWCTSVCRFLDGLDYASPLIHVT